MFSLLLTKMIQEVNFLGKVWTQRPIYRLYAPGIDSIHFPLIDFSRKKNPFCIALCFPFYKLTQHFVFVMKSKIYFINFNLYSNQDLIKNCILYSIYFEFCNGLIFIINFPILNWLAPKFRSIQCEDVGEWADLFNFWLNQ